MGLSDILSRLFGGSAAPAQSDKHVGDDDLAALLVAAARADEHYSHAEASHITRLLAARFHLDHTAADELRRRGEAAHDDAASDMFSFAIRLKKRYTAPQRLALLDSLWSVVLMDAERHPREEALMRQSASILGLSNRDRVHSRRRVEQRMALPRSNQ